MFDPYFVTIAAIAVLLVGLSKSGLLAGLGVVGVPLLTLIMPAREAAGVMLPVLIAMDVIAVYAYRKDFSWHILKIMLPGAAVGTIIGWVLWSFVSDAVVLLLVGVITLLFVLDAVLPLRKRLEGLPPSTPWGVFWGGLSGFTSFVSHTGGPPFQIYVMPQRLAPAFYSGTMAMFFAAVNAAKLVPYFFLGQLSLENLELAAMLVPLGLFGVIAGVYLVRRVSAKHFYLIAYGLVFLLSLKLIWDGLQSIMAGA
ncbi:MAG TPA: sulfite exporter TauE/SafE family protein [Devosia sp.]|nr:sulfite exporter TauE/SafE family protein [Devosia sp.]